MIFIEGIVTPEYIKVVGVKEGYYVNKVLDRGNIILFNITYDVREAYQVPKGLTSVVDNKRTNKEDE